MRSSAPDRDSYELERRPHVRSVIAQAVLLGRTMRTTLGGRHRDRAIRSFGSVRALQERFVRRAFPQLKSGPMIRPRGSGHAGGHVPRATVDIDGRVTHVDDVRMRVVAGGGDGDDAMDCEARWIVE